MPKRRGPFALVVLFVFTGVSLSGCYSHTVQSVPGHDNLQALAVFYGRYLGHHRGKPPANIDEFKSWLKKQEKSQFEKFAIDPNNLDAVFTSPRDNQPFGFVFSPSVASPGPD